MIRHCSWCNSDFGCVRPDGSRIDCSQVCKFRNWDTECPLRWKGEVEHTDGICWSCFYRLKREHEENNPAPDQMEQ